MNAICQKSETCFQRNMFLKGQCDQYLKKKFDQFKIPTIVVKHVFLLILKRFLLVCPLENIFFTGLLNVKTITLNAHL